MTVRQMGAAAVVIFLIIAIPSAIAGGAESFGEGLMTIWETWTDGE